MYIRNCMECEWDAAKSRQNRRKHGCVFEMVAGFDWNEAVEVLDDRFDCGEERWLALGPSVRNSMRWLLPPAAMTRCA